MRFEKRILGSLNLCYAVCAIPLESGAGLLFASEGRDSCFCHTGHDFENRETVWTEPGGTMSMVPMPGKAGEFWAIQKFFPVFQSEDAEIVHARRVGNRWTTQPVVRLPYCHRFDLLRSGGATYLIGCTLCASKKFQDDWSDPGKVYVGIVGEDGSSIRDLKVLKDGLTKNHGYCKIIRNGHECGLVACEEGIFLFEPPQVRGGEWRIEQVLNTPASDVAALDIDGDGRTELAVIEPFHGDTLCVYKENSIGTGFDKVYESKGQRAFFHVVKGGVLCGRPVFIAGCRAGARELFCLSARDGCAAFDEQIIDAGGGPANAEILNLDGRDLIAAANHGASQTVLYEVTD